MIEAMTKTMSVYTTSREMFFPFRLKKGGKGEINDVPVSFKRSVHGALVMEARWGDQRSGREMIQGKRMVLKGRMEIGHGRVPGIARLGKEAEIGKLEILDQLRVGRERCFGINPALPGM